MKIAHAVVWSLALISGTGQATAPQVPKSPPPPNRQLWSRIESVNEAIKKIGPLTTSEFGRWLGEAVSILRNPAFDANYQEIRAWSLQNDFSGAEILTKGAEPGFTIRFDGDYDIYQVNFATFKALAGPRHSEPAEFVDAYPKYEESLASMNPKWTTDCLIPFDLGKGVRRVKKNGGDRKAMMVQWKRFASRWKNSFLQSFAAKAVTCLEKK